MDSLQEQYDDAMFDFSMADYDGAIEKLRAVLEQDARHFDAQLALGMAFYRKGEYGRAIEEGHKAEQLSPKEQLVHTNLSLFYMKAGDKSKAEHHGLQARIASWRGDMAAPGEKGEAGEEEDLKMSQPKPPPVKVPDMPWKKNKKIGGD